MALWCCWTGQCWHLGHLAACGTPVIAISSQETKKSRGWRKGGEWEGMCWGGEVDVSSLASPGCKNSRVCSQPVPLIKARPKRDFPVHFGGLATKARFVCESANLEGCREQELTEEEQVLLFPVRVCSQLHGESDPKNKRSHCAGRGSRAVLPPVLHCVLLPALIAN